MGYTTSRGTNIESNYIVADDNYDERMSNGDITITIKYEALDGTVTVNQLFNDQWSTMVMSATQFQKYRSRCIDNGYQVINN